MTKPRLLVVAPFSCDPPRYGGPLRVRNLCVQLTADFEVEQWGQQLQRPDLHLPPRAVERSTAAGYSTHDGADPLSIGLYALSNVRWEAPPVWQSAVLSAVRPRWLRERLSRADVIVVEHPWQFRWVREMAPPSTPVAVSLQDEVGLYADLPAVPRPLRRRYAAALLASERWACREADQVFPHSAGDGQVLARRHSVDASGWRVVPNGVDVSDLAPSSGRRARARESLGLGQAFTVLFAASKHPPNVEAAQELLRWDLWSPSVRLVIAGGVGAALQGQVSRAGVLVTGSLEDMGDVFAAADAAVNPVIHGGGSNLKLLQYLSAGLPTVTTAEGARGFDLEAGRDVVIARREAFPDELRRLRDDQPRARALGRRGREVVEERHTWEASARTMADSLHRLRP